MAATLFKRHFGCTPTHVVGAPLGITLLGDSAECNESLVLSVAVNRFIQIASAPRADGKVELVCAGFTERESFWLSDLRRNPTAPWADGVKNVIEQLRRRGASLSGFSAAICDDARPGAGSGGPAALAVAAALTLRRLFPFSLTETSVAVPPKRNAQGGLPPLARGEKLHFARLCQAAGIELPGASFGLVEPVSSMLGKAWHVMSIDLRFRTVEHAPMIGEVIVVCDTGMAADHGRNDRHSGVGAMTAGRISEVRSSEAKMGWSRSDFASSCESAAGKLGAKTMRLVELRFLEANKSKLTPREYACARHAVSETQRVVFAERALQAEDHRQVGQFMFQSHESSRDGLKHSSPECDLLVELARLHPGCLGARRCGGGPGVATINLVAYHQAESFMQQMARRYLESTGLPLQPIVCQVAGGAG